MVERMLGAPKGSIKRIRFLEALQSMEFDRADQGSTAKAGVP
jgi:hypothetical protein